MPTRRQIKIPIKIQYRVEVKRTIRRSIRPVSYAPLGAGSIERAVCDECNLAFEAYALSGEDSLYCPNCGQSIPLAD